MTRGREVQDFLKSQHKTAKQMFEEHDWSYSHLEKYLASVPNLKIIDEIVYTQNHKEIHFDLIGIEYDCSDKLGECIGIDMDTHKLINAQLKELGWL